MTKLGESSMLNKGKRFWHWFLVCAALAQTVQAEERKATCMGRVLDDRKQPVEGVEMTIVPGRAKAVTTDSKGQFKINWISRRGSENRRYFLVARHRTANLGLVFPIRENMDPLDLILQHGITLMGKVANAKGMGIPAVRFDIDLKTPPPYGREFLERFEMQTDAHGRFIIKAIPPENRYSVVVAADGYGQADIDIDAQEAKDHYLDLGEIRLARADMTVTGRVVDLSGNPVPDMDVYCITEGRQPRCHTKSGKQGDFVLKGLCAGTVRFVAEGRVQGENVSCQILTEAGARDVKAVLMKGYGHSRYVRTKSHEEIARSGNLYVVGRAVDEDGVPVADVPVHVRCVQCKNEEGKDTESYFNLARFGDVTDEWGCFAIELEEEATYSLLFSPTNHAAVIAYDVSVDTKDLHATLPAGSTLLGRLMRIKQGRQVPIANVEVELKQANRTSYSHIGFDRDRKTKTDAEGRFRFEHLRTLIRDRRDELHYAPRVWELCYEDAVQTVQFLDGEKTKQVDLIVRPKLENARSLISRSLPEFHGIDIAFDWERVQDRPILICFFDYEQRPSRRCILQLTQKAAVLQGRGLNIIAVQCSEVPKESLAAWAEKQETPFSVGTLTGSVAEIRFDWNVQSLPWLTLTDKEHVVQAEGFSIAELGAKLP
jgi:protocatechuate 3,4-dioxygenase beta subunit